MIKPELAKDRKTLRGIDLAEYIAEKKFDGERIIAIKKGDDIILQRRSGKIATHQYPEIVEAIRQSFDFDITFDGEMVVFNNDVDDFQALTTRTHLKDENEIYKRSLENPATYVLFDILHAHNADLRQKDLLTRKRYLDNFYEKYIQDTPAYERLEIVWKTTHVELMLEEAEEKGWEGIILKPIHAMYMENSRKQWIKLKITHDADLVFTDYEENPRGIKLLKYSHDIEDDIILSVSEKEPIVIQCTGAQSKEVKDLIDEFGEVKVTVGYMNITNANRLRMPTFKKLVDFKNSTT